jgi:YD repeat protein
MVGMCDYKIATRYTALNDYIPIAPTNDEAKKHNENLPGMGGVFNVITLHVYHYAGYS